MSEYLTPANVAIVISLLASLYAVLKAVAPKTKTTVDDKIVSFVEEKRAWVRNYAWPIWSVVEQLQKQGKVLKNSKYGEYIAVFREAFKQAYGHEMPKELEIDAQLMAQGLSAADKLEKESSIAIPIGTPITASLDGSQVKGWEINPLSSQDAAK